jgi:hypothetical protein
MYVRDVMPVMALHAVHSMCATLHSVPQDGLYISEYMRSRHVCEPAACLPKRSRHTCGA